MRGSLGDIGVLTMNKSYNMVFGNWALSYLDDEDVKNVVKVIRNILKKDGILILKESVLDDNEYHQRKCSSG